MWGVGASISPYIMSFSLIRLDGWSYGYLIVAIIQAVLCAFIFISLPMWKKVERAEVTDEAQEQAPSLSFKEIFSIKNAIHCFLMFLGYCALELTTSLWVSSYLVQKWQFTPEIAAGLAGMYYLGLTFGRFINGFLAMKLGDHFLIRMGLGIISVGIILLFIPLSSVFALIGFILIGLGCAPVYPCIIHMTPDVFGRDKSQAMIGVQMAFAYVGFLVMPPLFGLIADHISISLLPVYQLILLALIIIMHEVLMRGVKKNNQK